VSLLDAGRRPHRTAARRTFFANPPDHSVWCRLSAQSAADYRRDAAWPALRASSPRLRP